MYLYSFIGWKHTKKHVPFWERKLKTAGKTAKEFKMKRFVFFALVFMVCGFSVYAQVATGIKVNTSLGGTLYLNNQEVATLWDNDSHVIPIETPGTYTVKIRLADGREITKTVVISARGIVELGFLMPPNNIRIGTVGADTLPVMWDSAGSNVRYNVYYNTENHVDSAQVQRNITTTMITLSELQWNRTYYVWISVTENSMEGAKSTAISQALLTTRQGQIGPGGGIIFYDKGSFSDGWQYLEAAPADTEVRAIWGNYNVRTDELKAGIGTGRSNTRIIVDSLGNNSGRNYAARACYTLVYNGFNDWFLPSREELILMYNNLARRGLGGFQNAIYWSSYAYLSQITWVVFMNLGSSVNPAAHHRVNPGTTFTYSGAESAEFRVRAIRAF